MSPNILHNLGHCEVGSTTSATILLANNNTIPLQVTLLKLVTLINCWMWFQITCDSWFFARELSEPFQLQAFNLLMIKINIFSFPLFFQYNFSKIAHFTIAPSSGKIGPGEEIPIEITFCPSQFGSFSKKYVYIDTVFFLRNRNCSPYLFYIINTSSCISFLLM